MVRMRTDVTDIIGVARHRVWISCGVCVNGAEDRLLPTMCLPIAIGKGNNGGIAVVLRAKGGEPLVAIVDWNLEWGVTGARRLHVHEHEKIRRPEEIRIALVEIDRGNRRVLLGSAV